ncbi:uncharacterized protein N7484_007862 [Penicillium longicatenatum]|uniref:uncharacterized protein n=1 Tax=Penicillium longicatenatum TaxID=1561947 RepID=UPI002546ED14|nr:uncharacterized protein N7484_007862 [Penicillium longicatenatum]KAJ5640000.1 hypothetical protein N7484_007862 [Penicillium longicatenatum]
MEGNILGLKDLFASGQATPFDQVNTAAEGLLGYAFVGIEGVASFEFLLSQGADPFSWGNNVSNTLGYLVWSGSCGIEGQGHGRSLLPSLRIVLRHMQELVYDTEEETLDGVLNEFHGTAEEFLFLQREICPSFFLMSKQTRIAVAIGAASGHWDASHMPQTIRTILGPGTLEVDDLQFGECLVHDGYYRTLVHCVARKIGQNLALSQHMEYTLKFHGANSHARQQAYDLQKSHYQAWNKLFLEFLYIGVDVHHLLDRRTPFLSFLEGYITWLDEKKYLVMSWNSGFRVWLKELQAAGVNLQQFGQTEERIWKKELGELEREYFASKPTWGGPWSRPLIGFSYGSSPNNWVLWLSEGCDSFALDFWTLIERQIEIMPGGWSVD